MTLVLACPGQVFLSGWLSAADPCTHIDDALSTTHRVMERIFNHLRHMDVNV